MRNELEPLEYDERELAMFAALPRESELDAAGEERVVKALHAEGYFRRAPRRAQWVLKLAAAAALFAAGGFAGNRYAMRNSLETNLARRDLSLSDRVLLLQRAGSAYVRAANGYADATVRVDSSAVEVASQVLVGAAMAVARRSLDGGMSTRLATAMQGQGAIQ
jgi:hypothetical protein